jgi:D-alanyl-lipoteichoic acid acyltransferase DltB (MBOAT superfamily)
MDLTWVYISGYSLLLLVAGYLLPFNRQKRTARLYAWVIVIITVLLSTVFTSDQPPLVRMVTIVFLQLLSMKIVVAVESYPGGNRLKPFQWMAFALGWFGMRPVLFEKLPSPSLPFIQLVVKGVSRIVLGFFLLYLSTVLEQYPLLSGFFLPQLLLLVGISLILHFGILNLSTAAWRAFGVNVPELFRSPFRSKSLKEFWGKRWNIAFSEMTALVAYRPLKTKIGVEKAVIVSFLLSGLLHEIAISLPARAGYGLPMIYFGIHAFAMHLEAKSPLIQKITRHKLLSHVWVMTLLVLPMPLLFHTAFMQHVLIPLRTVLLFR